MGTVIHPGPPGRAEMFRHASPGRPGSGRVGSRNCETLGWNQPSKRLMRTGTGRRAIWGLVLLDRLCQDLRYGCRMLAGSPGFTSVAVLSLAMGIGANCAIFSFADALLLRPLPVARPGEILTVGSPAP